MNDLSCRNACACFPQQHSRKKETLSAYWKRSVLCNIPDILLYSKKPVFVTNFLLAEAQLNSSQLQDLIDLVAKPLTIWSEKKINDAPLKIGENVIPLELLGAHALTNRRCFPGVTRCSHLFTLAAAALFPVCSLYFLWFSK